MHWVAGWLLAVRDRVFLAAGGCSGWGAGVSGETNQGGPCWPALMVSGAGLATGGCSGGVGIFTDRQHRGTE